MRALRLIVLVSTGLTGCDRFLEEEIHHAYVDQGTVCVRGHQTAAGEAYDENASLRVEYRLDVCLSSSCTHDRIVGCTVERDGDGIVIHTHASWIERGSVCTADCGRVEATCELDGLPPGRYTVSLGNRSLPLEIPSVADTPLCLERA